jgi:hypothetical protein
VVRVCETRSHLYNHICAKRLEAVQVLAHQRLRDLAWTRPHFVSRAVPHKHHLVRVQRWCARGEWEKGGSVQEEGGPWQQSLLWYACTHTQAPPPTPPHTHPAHAVARLHAQARPHACPHARPHTHTVKEQVHGEGGRRLETREWGGTVPRTVLHMPHWLRWRCTGTHPGGRSPRCPRVGGPPCGQGMPGEIKSCMLRPHLLRGGLSAASCVAFAWPASLLSSSPAKTQHGACGVAFAVGAAVLPKVEALGAYVIQPSCCRLFAGPRSTYAVASCLGMGVCLALAQTTLGALEQLVWSRGRS